jgi:hypothetical protein
VKKVHIATLYLGGARYRIHVKVNGRTVDTVPASPGTVTKTRNKLNSEWSHVADEVTADAIPEAFDIAPKKGKAA